MSAPPYERLGLGAAARRVADSINAIVRLELQLAAAEVKRKLGEIGVGVGLIAAAALFALYAVGFLLATLTAGIATALPWWAALLIVSVFLLVLVAVLALVGKSIVEKAAPVVPEQAIQEAKLTQEALKNGQH